jgi:hypothetical protein
LLVPAMGRARWGGKRLTAASAMRTALFPQRDPSGLVCWRRAPRGICRLRRWRPPGQCGATRPVLRPLIGVAPAAGPCMGVRVVFGGKRSPAGGEGQGGARPEPGCALRPRIRWRRAARRRISPICRAPPCPEVRSARRPGASPPITSAGADPVAAPCAAPARRRARRPPRSAPSPSRRSARLTGRAGPGTSNRCKLRAVSGQSMSGTFVSRGPAGSREAVGRPRPSLWPPAAGGPPPSACARASNVLRQRKSRARPSGRTARGICGMCFRPVVAVFWGAGGARHADRAVAHVD